MSAFGVSFFQMKDIVEKICDALVEVDKQILDIKKRLDAVELQKEPPDDQTDGKAVRE